MNIPVELPSGKIVNIARFIALLPVTSREREYILILDGYPEPIKLEPKDADALKYFLQLDAESVVNTNNLGGEKYKQLQQNKRAIALLGKRIERHKNMSQTESLQRRELFEEFQQTIDAKRLPGQKLYSQS
ncbi:MAG: hypothetical protein VKL59_23805 [Nostocaceae cyanobacterium]|nr:hypothetical protein [Nostocaceae cyanobacterium]